MSRIYDSNEYQNEAGNSSERNCSEWKRKKNVIQRTAQQQHVTSMPVTYIARPSYCPIEDGLWQSRRPKQEYKNMASSLGLGYRSVKSLNTISQTHNLQELRLRAGSPQIPSSIGDIINTEHGFTIQLDTRHFQPRDIQVTLHQNTLSVTGDRLEDDGTGAQRLHRSFTRKYIIPSDVRLSSLSSYTTNNGYLIIKGSRKGWKETDLTKHLASTSISNESMTSAV
uniref:Collagen alpha, putative n=1 Tax=Brugia malayi TaxID=6279 RepID=A0A8L7TIR9_BRUMA